jgi:hypothetical protein
VSELFPIACGLLTGSLVGALRPSLRLAAGAALAVVFGVVATVLSGEAQVSWAFLLIDIPLVAASAVAATAIAQTVRRGPCQPTYRSLEPVAGGSAARAGCRGGHGGGATSNVKGGADASTGSAASRRLPARR